MKVVLAHKCFYKKGGAEVFFFEVGRVLKEHGHEVAYFSCNDEQNIESEWSEYFIDAPDFKASNPVKKWGRGLLCKREIIRIAGSNKVITFFRLAKPAWLERLSA